MILLSFFKSVIYKGEMEISVGEKGEEKGDFDGWNQLCDFGGNKL